jgi:putative heme iron utilization protein
MDIVFTTYGTRILVNIVIVNPTHANLVLQIASSWGMATTIIAQVKIVSYHDRHLEDNFIPLII